ncbi:hypothetical protein F5B22DRAFT_86566 [Xylaria bambusicola]|uniref:uncharacterized protein n=1 Tax=Xylaria bambusicola TaxID=326684 RepID=UPI002007E022|nr:uncharacterized protein F5B22DRAFT_86566 [Xylaria bambusicola]KAI0517971.1 hypothetical protein F5B22DRAFT_86566 [Xylaria bambusicola]
MGSDSGEPRPSTESTDSQTPFIQEQSLPFRPPPPPSNYLEGNVSSVRNATTNINLAAVIVTARILAAISGLAVGISFILIPRHWDMEITIALTVFFWFTIAWDILLLTRMISKPSLRISLVLRDGRAINFLSRDDDEEGHEGRRRGFGWPRAFWVDLTLLAVLFSLTIANHVHGWGRHQLTTGLGWFPIFFHIIIAVLTASPKMATAHVRFERTDRAQIALA